MLDPEPTERAEARDQTCVLMEASQICWFPLSHDGNAKTTSVVSKYGQRGSRRMEDKKHSGFCNLCYPCNIDSISLNLRTAYEAGAPILIPQTGNLKQRETNRLEPKPCLKLYL